MLNRFSMKTIAAASATALVFAIAPTYAQAAEDSPTSPVTNEAFLQEGQGQSTDMLTVDNGLLRTGYFVVTGTDGKEYTTNYANNTGEGLLRSTSFVDPTRTASVKARMQLSNPTVSPVNINIEQWCVPGDHAPSVCEKVLLPAADFATVSVNQGEVGVNVTYRVAGGSWVDQTTLLEEGYTAADVQAVQIRGPLEAGQTVTVDLPLDISSVQENLSALDQNVSYELREIAQPYGDRSQRTQKARVAIRFMLRDPILNASGADILTTSGPYVAVVRERSQDTETTTDTSTFVLAPAEIQALMPAQSLDDLTISHDGVNFHSANEDSTLYVGDFYTVNLARVKDVLAGTGWSVNNESSPYNVNNSVLADEYGYGPAGESDVVITDASTGELLTLDGANTYGSVYLEVFQYIEAHDLTIKVGDEYSVADSLDWIRAYNLEELATGESTDLDALVSDPENLPANPAKPISIVSNVDTSKAGTYQVTFNLNLEDGETVSKTVTVTVEQGPDPKPEDEEDSTSDTDVSQTDGTESDDAEKTETKVIPFPIPVPVPAGGSSGSSQAGTPAQNTPAQATSAQVAPAQSAQTSQKASRGVLANTGASTGLAVAVAAALLAAGGALLLRTRRNN